MAHLENKSGNFVAPSLETTQASLAAVELPENLVAFLPDPEGEQSYPIVSFSWLLCYRKYHDPKIAEGVRKMVIYCLDEGQQQAELLGYIPLPAPVIVKVKEAVKLIGKQ